MNTDSDVDTIEGDEAMTETTEVVGSIEAILEAAATDPDYAATLDLSPTARAYLSGYRDALASLAK